MRFALGSALKKWGLRATGTEAKATNLIEQYQASTTTDASKFLKNAKDHHKKSELGNWLDIDQVPENDKNLIFSTRFLITSRCANNAGTIVFDSQDRALYARGQLELPLELLDVSNLDLEDIILSTSAVPTFFPAIKIGDFSFQDGGVVANDPSLISTSFGFAKFCRSDKASVYDQTEVYKQVWLPAIKLLVVGCGEEIICKDPFPGWKSQGKLSIVAQEVADMFMSADSVWSDQTNLLSKELSTTSTLTSFKLNVPVPRAKDPSTISKKVENAAISAAKDFLQYEKIWNPTTCPWTK